MTQAADTQRVYKCKHCKDLKFIVYEVKVNEATNSDGVKMYPDAPDFYTDIDGHPHKATVTFARPCEYCRGDDRKRALFQDCGIPFQYSINNNKFSWTSYQFMDIEKKQNACNNYIKDFTEMCASGAGLYIWSAMNGTGKTALACYIGNRLLCRSVDVKFIKAVDLIDANTAGLIDQYERCDLLILDDIGKKRTGMDWYDEILLRLIDKRYNKKQCTIYTSNYPLEELSIDGAVYSRINSRTVSIQMPDVNIREANDGMEKDEITRKLIGA